MKNALLLSLLLVLPVALAVQNINDFGAKAHDKSNAACTANALALQKAFIAANTTSSTNLDDRTVLVPAGSTYYIFPVDSDRLNQVTFQIDGDLIVSNDFDHWPVGADGQHPNIFYFSNCFGLTIQGSGSVDGQGYDWWWRTVLNILKHGRPHMFQIEVCENLLFQGLRLFNSPQFHILANDVLNANFFDMYIHVDITAQTNLLGKHGLIQGGIPIFPLNTDGIDPSGRNIHIRNLTIDNFDDAVAVKPMNKNGVHSDCSENILVEHCHVRRGVGMTIGSVPPHPNVNCVRNVTFRDVYFSKPYKAIYVKTNPPHSDEKVESGIIENILYENMYIDQPVWWPVYIGPQQQKQPDGGGPGCLTYPLNKNCPTDPLVTIRGITLRNITINQALLSPITIRCNATNPCTDIVFENVVANHWKLGIKGFVCENVQGTTTGSSPVLDCLTNLDKVDDLEPNAPFELQSAHSHSFAAEEFQTEEDALRYYEKLVAERMS